MIADAIYNEFKFDIDVRVRASNGHEEINFDIIPELTESLAYEISMNDEMLQPTIYILFLLSRYCGR